MPDAPEQHEQHKQPDKPLLIYDGDCGFCKRSVERWRRMTGDAIAYAASRDVADDYPDIPREQYARSVVFVDADSRWYTGAEAVYRSLARAPGRGLGWWAYRHVPGFAQVSEYGYRFVAEHRKFASTVLRLLWGRDPGPPEYLLTRWLFLRLIGVVYLIAFLSLAVQIVGLVGEHGIAPAQDFLRAVAERFPDNAHWQFPTVFWWGCSDAALVRACYVGAALAVLLILRIAPTFMLILLWVLYLSLTVVGGVFLHFQWDVLLLEAGLLSIFIAPLRLWPRLGREPPPSRIALFLLRFLLFRLMFESGAVKLTSGDAIWSDWTALDFHYLTQPLPTGLAWYAHHLPAWIQKASVGIMYVIELGLPFLIFTPRRLRFVAAGGIALLMTLIGLTGNYNFFNLLTLALCVTLLDDAFLRRFVPKRVIERARGTCTFRLRRLRCAMMAILAAYLVLVGAVRGIQGTWRSVEFSNDLLHFTAYLEPLRSINAYGLFRVMTTQRREIVVEGSMDGQEWREYVFRWKPGEVTEPPCFVQPHQPRLDWQMWFAALGDYRSPSNRWFMQFLSRLAEGRKEVIALLANDPFPDEPPRYLRARLFDYAFTDSKTRDETGAWWTRTELGPYTPVFSRRR